MAEVLVVREYAMMRSSLFGYRDTVLHLSVVRGSRAEPEYSALPHGVTTAFSLLKSGLFVGYDEPRYSSEKDLN